MWKAVRILAGKGIIESHKGAGIFRPGTYRASHNVPCPAMPFTDELRSLITDGTYHTGEFLPKVRYFTIGGKHSATTVVKSFSELALEGIVHKQGKQWVAGKAMVPVSQSGEEGPVVIFLVLNDSYWSIMFRQPFTSPFVSALASELLKHRIGLTVAAIQKQKNELSALPAAEEQILPLIRRLGNRYQGTIVTFFPHDLLSQWVKLLARFCRPVISYNMTNERTSISAKSLSLKKGAFTGVYLDEEAAVKLALERLSAFGHTIIGVPVYTATGHEGARRRMETIRACALGCFPDIRIVETEQLEPWWKFGSVSSIPEFVASIGLSPAESAWIPGSPLPVKLRKALMELTPSMQSLVDHPGLTAVIALNNDMARKYYYWCLLMNITIPKQLSMISFDNTLESVTFPITTIDFGFPRLGYLAAHILIGDIPVKTDRQGHVPGVCELVDRGSVRRI